MPINKQKPIIDIRDVSFHFGETAVLDHVTATINEGEYVGIIGPNGAGKTTLLKIILGTLIPSTGDIYLFGKSSSEFKQKKYIGYVPQYSTQSEFYFPATVLEIVASGRTPHLTWFREPSDKDARAVKKAIEVTELGGLENKLISELSGGQRQRVFLARALAGEPKILILDEPDIGVDAQSQKKFYDFIKNLNKKLSLTIILVSHDIDLIADQVTTVICLNHDLVCHVATKDFMKEEYIEKIYGEPKAGDHFHHS